MARGGRAQRMDERAAAMAIGGLRARRVTTPRAERAAPLTPDFEGLQRRLTRERRGLGNAAEAWGAVCPPALVCRTAIVGLARGTLTIRVADASARFEIDRAMRDGGETTLIRACSAPVRKVRLVIGGSAPPLRDPA